MFGYSKDDRVFFGYDGSILLPLQIVSTGIDSAKPSANSNNNGKLYLATDSEILYGVVDGVRHIMGRGKIGNAVKIPNADNTNVQGQSGTTSVALSDHMHEIDGDIITIDFSPSNYNPTTSNNPASQVEHLAAHLKGIDVKLDTLESMTSGITIGGSPTNITPDAQNESGSSGDAADVNHRHGIVTGSPSDVGNNNVEGNSNQFARRNHEHNHPTGMHERGSSREIDGDRLDIDFSPSNYTPDSSPSEVSNVDELSSHLKGIDNIVKTITINTSAPSNSDGNDGDIWLEY